jgi:hypothetical protein
MNPQKYLGCTVACLFQCAASLNAIEVEVLGPEQAISGVKIPGLFEPTPSETAQEPSNSLVDLTRSTERSFTFLEENRLEDAVLVLTSSYGSLRSSLEFKNECYVAFTLAYGVRRLEEVGNHEKAATLSERVLKLLAEVEERTDPLDTVNRAAITRIRRYLTGQGDLPDDSGRETEFASKVKHSPDSSFHSSFTGELPPSTGSLPGSGVSGGEGTKALTARLSVAFTSGDARSVVLEIAEAGSYLLEASDDLQVWRLVESKVRTPGRYEIPLNNSFGTCIFFRVVQSPAL